MSKVKSLCSSPAPSSPILVSSLLKNGSLLTIFSLDYALLNTKCRAILMEFLLDELNFQSRDVEGPTNTIHVAMEAGKLAIGVTIYANDANFKGPALLMGSSCVPRSSVLE